MLVVSAQFSLQAPVNARLAVATGRIPAALVSFLVGTGGLALVVLISGGAGGLADIGDAAAWELCGGLIGAAFVLIALATVPMTVVDAAASGCGPAAAPFACRMNAAMFTYSSAPRLGRPGGMVADGSLRMLRAPALR